MQEFAGRKLVIATMHGKETVMAPLFEQALGVKCFVAKGLNTDYYGTFCGEVGRMDDTVTTLRKKCEVAMEMYNCDLAVASEGTFGPHNGTFFLCDEELTMLTDKKNCLEIVAKVISTKTNFNGEVIENLPELHDFATRAKFPSHGLILRGANAGAQTVVKGITDIARLVVEFNSLRTTYGNVYIQTDMRALYNPLRMAVIEQATEKLIKTIQARCPACETPGYSVSTAEPGLPCSLCGLPTRSNFLYVYKCKKCGFHHEELYPDQIRTEDPQYCDNCNP